MSGTTKLMTAGGGGVSLTPASSIASDVTVNVPSSNGTLVSTGETAQVSSAMLSTGAPSWDSSGVFSFNSGYGSVATAYGCRAWVNFNGTGTVAIRASGNVSSITDNGTGDYTVNFTAAMPDSNYSTTGSATGVSDTIRAYRGPKFNSYATGNVRVRTGFYDSVAGDVPQDVEICCVSIFR